MVTVSLPFWANSGQCLETKSSQAIWPRSSSMYIQDAVSGLVEDISTNIVLSVTGLPSLMVPPWMSRTRFP